MASGSHIWVGAEVFEWLLEISFWRWIWLNIHTHNKGLSVSCETLLNQRTLCFFHLAKPSYFRAPGLVSKRTKEPMPVITAFGLHNSFNTLPSDESVYHSIGREYEFPVIALSYSQERTGMEGNGEERHCMARNNYYQKKMGDEKTKWLKCFIIQQAQQHMEVSTLWAVDYHWLEQFSQQYFLSVS